MLTLPAQGQAITFSSVMNIANPMWQPVLQKAHILREEIYSSGSTSGPLSSLGNQTENETMRLTDIKKNGLKQNIYDCLILPPA